MREAQPKLVKREEYAPPPFWIRSVELTFDLERRCCCCAC